MLVNLIVTFLTPMFLSTTAGDLEQARAAAVHAVTGYTARDPAGLLLIAQSFALGLAVLSSISLSMAENIPINLILRLRGNATSLHRAATQCRRALSEPGPAASPHQAPPLPTAAVARPQPPAPRQQEVDVQVPTSRSAPPLQRPDTPDTRMAAMAILAAESEQRIAEADIALKVTGQPIPQRSSAQPSLTEDEHRRFAWASMLAAQEFVSQLATVSPGEPNPAASRAAALATTANPLFTAGPSPPAP